MALELWDTVTLEKTLDSTTKLPKFLGVYSLGSSSAGTGTITDSRFTAYGGYAPFIFTIADGGGIENMGNGAVWSFSGNNLNWAFPNATRPSQTIIYGVRPL